MADSITIDETACKQIFPFVLRWKQKVRKGRNETTYVFDKFIANFVIYSALVNVIKPIGQKIGQDNEYCTTKMKIFLSEKYDLEKLVQKLDQEVNKLSRVIELYPFNVLYRSGQKIDLYIKWQICDNSTKIQSLLETLYSLRCNLFHGAKEFSNNQVALLTPAYKCLEIINNIILSIYSKKIQA